VKLSACAAIAILVTTPVLADPPGNATRNIQMSNYNDYTVVGQDEPDTQHLSTPCVRMMQRAFYLPDPASLDRAMDAHREMDMARNAFQAGDEFACQHHAMRALGDRS